MIPSVFSRGQAIHVGLTSIGIRVTATPTQISIVIVSRRGYPAEASSISVQPHL
jgi:hypothetical protein